MPNTNDAGAFPILSEQACPRCLHKPCRTMLSHGALAMAFASADVPFKCPFRVEDPAALDRLEKEILKNLARRPPQRAASGPSLSGPSSGGHAGGQRMAGWLRIRSLTALWLRFGSPETAHLKAWEESKRKTFLKLAEKEAKENQKEMVPMFEEDDDISLGVALDLDEPLSMSTAVDVDEPITLQAGVEDA